MQRCGHRGTTKNSAVNWLSNIKGGMTLSIEIMTRTESGRATALEGTGAVLNQDNLARERSQQRWVYPEAGEV